MKKVINVLFFSLILLVFYSCAHVGLTVSKSCPPKPEGCNLDVYFSESEIKRPYEVIALIDSKTASNAFADKTVAGAIKLAKPKACQCGADGILVFQVENQGVTYGSYGSGKAMIKCIRYTDKK